MKNFTPYSCISPKGYIVNFDTQKRRKYTTLQEDRVLDLNRWGLSLREIVTHTHIPLTSVRNILIRRCKLLHKDQSKPSLSWLDRSECLSYYDMTSHSFDYVKNRYPQYYLNKDGKVFIHVTYINEYYFGHKGHKDRYI